MTDSSRPVPNARRHVTGRPTPTSRALDRASQGSRTSAAAVPRRPPDSAPVNAGSVEYAVTAQMRAGAEIGSPRRASQDVRPASGIDSSSTTSTAALADPRRTPASSTRGSSHAGESDAEPTPTWCHAVVYAAQRSPAPSGAGTSAPPSSTPSPSRPRTPIRVVTSRPRRTRVPGRLSRRRNRLGRVSSSYQPSGSSVVESRTEREASACSRPATRSATRSNACRACAPRAARRWRTSLSGTAPGAAPASATRAREALSPDRSATESRNAPHSSRAASASLPRRRNSARTSDPTSWRSVTSGPRGPAAWARMRCMADARSIRCGRSGCGGVPRVDGATTVRRGLAVVHDGVGGDEHAVAARRARQQRSTSSRKNGSAGSKPPSASHTSRRTSMPALPTAEDVAVAVVLALVELAPLEPRPAVARAGDGDAGLEQCGAVAPAAHLGAEDVGAAVPVGRAQQRLEGMRSGCAVVVQQPDPADGGLVGVGAVRGRYGATRRGGRRLDAAGDGSTEAGSRGDRDDVDDTSPASTARARRSGVSSVLPVSTATSRSGRRVVRPRAVITAGSQRAPSCATRTAVTSCRRGGRSST